MMPLAVLAIAGCLAVPAASDRITAGDLAAAIPGLIVPVASAEVALAPAPGVQRIFHVPELRRLALRYQWNVEPTAEVCFERPVSPSEPSRILEAMQKALPQATIRILEYSRRPLPSGEMEFPLAALSQSAAGAYWSGSLRYGGSHRLTLWARVTVTTSATRVIAATDLRPGEPIDRAAVRVEIRDVQPSRAKFLDALDQAVAKWPRAPIRAGTPIREDMLQDPKEIQRGDTVMVDIYAGAAHLELPARAEDSGAIGEWIPVTNPETHKRFPARVEGKGRVSVGTAPKVNP